MPQFVQAQPGNIQGIAPVMAPTNGTAIDGNAYANHVFTLIDNTSGFPQNYGTAGDIFYWEQVYPGDGGGVFDILPIATPPYFDVSEHSYPGVDDYTVVRYIDDITNKDPTIFLGRNKINDNPNTYEWGVGSNPNKNEIQNAGVIFTRGNPEIQGINGEYGDPNDLWVSWAADREVTNGSSYIDFEFLQKPFYMDTLGQDNAGYYYGKFYSEADPATGGRTPGDILVTVEFTNGGPVANVIVLIWTQVGDTYQYVHYTDYPHGTILATVNTEKTYVHFPAFGNQEEVSLPGTNGGPGYTGMLPYYDINQWCEGAINLSAFFDEVINPCFGIATVFTRTRTSGESATAELKDFPGPPAQVSVLKNPPVVECPGNVEYEPCTELNLEQEWDDWRTSFKLVEGTGNDFAEVSITQGDTPLPEDLPSNVSCGFTVTHWIKAVDYCGDMDSCSATFTVLPDEVAPELTVPEDVTVECDAVPTVGTASATDNCNGEVAVEYVGEEIIGTDCPSVYTIVRTWTATDACGNSVSASQTISVVDTTAPVLTLPADIRFECEMGDAGMATAEDNCDGMLEPSYSDDLSGLDNCGFGDVLRTWIVTDCAGNTSSDVQTITIYDDTAPVLTLPADIRFECEMGDAGMATAEDNCDGMLEPSYSDDLSGLDNCGFGDILRTWTVTDCAGNTSSDVQTITIYDDTAPVLTLPADIRFECEMGDAGMATAEDNCDGMLEPSYSDDLSGLDNCGFGDILRTWTVTDCAGNTSSDVQTITIYDDTAPVLTLPADIRFECEMGDAGMATAEDNCDGMLEPSYSDDLSGLDNCGFGDVLRTWTVTDCAGNTSSDVQTITIYDDTAPVLTLPADIRFECEMGDAGMATAEDNCDGMLEPSYSDDLSGLDNCGFGDILRTWTVTDCAGNTSSDVQTITIYDDTAPVLTLPADIRFECEMGDAGMATAEDNCDGMLEPSYSDDLSGLDNCGFGDILRTWTVTDCAGNTSSDVQTITIYDDTAPVLTLPADIRFECEMGDAGMATAEDNCDGMLEPSYSDDLSGLDNCGFGDILRTWTVTDCAGNTSSDVQTITIYDDTAPVLTLPADIRFECEMGDAGMATAEDNCDGMLEPSYSDDLSGLDNCGFGDILRTWTVTDCAGNTSSDVQTITIYDDTAPVLTLPADIRFECEMGDAGMATAEDNCDGMLEPSYSDDLSGLDNCGFGDILRTWTVTDCAGNTSSDVQTITIYDDTAPVLTLPADIRFECEMGDAGMATAEDNCDGMLEPSYSDDLSGLDNCGFGDILRTWTVTDCAGNTSSDVQTITIYDDTAPVLTLPADIRFECEMGDAGMATAEDNCDGMLEPSYSDDLSGLDNCGFGDILRTWTVTDCAGNTSSDVQTITIYDDTAPVLTLPADIRFECEMGDAGMATVEDNCDGMLEPSYSDDLSGLDNCGFGDILRTWTVTDCAGNTSSDVQTITIYDDTAPVLTLPADIRFECEMGDAGMATAEDNCDGMLEPSYSDDLSGLDNCGFGDILRTWTVTDCAGNTSSDVQTITIYDDTAPVLTLPADIRFECEMGDAGMATAEDNCDGMLEPSYSDDLSGLDNCGFGDILRTWTVTDCAGNTSSDVQTITIYDDTAPVLTLPADIRFECEMGDAGMATAEDNCDGMLEPSYSDDLSGLDNCGFGDILRTWTVTDCAGNTSSDVQTITIYDDTAPVLSLPADIRFECEMGDAGMATAEDNCDGMLEPSYSDDLSGLDNCGFGDILRTWTVTDCAGNTSSDVQTITIYDDTAPVLSLPADIRFECEMGDAGMATAEDNCDGMLEPSYSDDLSGLDNCGFGDILRTWTVTDCAGNTSSDVQTITIYDDTAPVLTLPADIRFECEMGDAGMATAEDNCDGMLEPSYSDDLSGLDNCGFGDILRTWTVTDCAGNTSSDVQTITIYDDTAPVLTLPADIRFECEMGDAGMATVEDNCDGMLEPSYSDDLSGLDNCGFGDILRTWTVTDCAGNTSSDVQTITIYDDTAPVLTLPADIRFECEMGDAGMATAEDNCDGMLEPSYSDDLSGLDNCGFGDILRTWTVTDCAGNTSSDVQTITIYDDTAPVLTLPADIRFECEMGDAGMATAEDNCDGMLEPSYSDDLSGLDNCGFGDILRTWTVTDCAGNTSSDVQTITIYDDTAPVLTLPADIRFECEMGDAGMATAEDNCDGMLEPSYSDDLSGLDNCGFGDILRTWTVTDCAGNTSSDVQTITIYDDTAPVLTLPADISFECEMGDAGMATAEDNCDGMLEPSYSDDLSGLDNCGFGDILRTWTVTDCAGNTSSDVQTITIYDDTAPVLTLPADIRFECEMGDAGMATAEDNCDGMLEPSYSDDLSGLDNCGFGDILRTWTVTDCAGNTSSDVQTITIYDDTAPVLTLPADIRFECEMGDAGMATVEDNCDGMLEPSYSDDLSGLDNCGFGDILRTWTVTDCAGNTSSDVQTITIYDDTAPVLTLPADIRFECEMGDAGMATAEDNCDGMLEPSYSDDLSGLDNCGFGDILRTWTVTDCAGNTSSDVQTITIYDDTAPVLTLPADIRFECEMGDAGMATAEDNCDGMLEPSYSDDLSGLDNCGFGDILRTWTVTDCAGNTSSDVQTITIYDDTAPVLSLPADIRFECEMGDAGMATAEDNCDGMLEPSYSDDLSGLDNCGFGDILRTWTVTDCAGNTSSDVQTITIYDDTAPVLSLPADIRFECEMGDAGMATAEDNCDGMLEPSYSDDLSGLDNCGFGDILRTWTVTDCAGNTSSDVQTITIYDDTAPVLTLPADIRFECEMGDAGMATAEDNCDGMLEPSYSDDLSGLDNCGFGDILRTWTVTDCAGNTSSDVQTITIYDDTAPVLTLPADIRFECEMGDAGMATVEDNCDGMLEPSYSDDLSGLDNCGFGDILRTWTVTDCAGNTSSDVQTITIYDDTAPVLTLPADIRFECEMGDAGMATAEDNCDGMLEPSYSDDLSGLDNCGFGDILRTWTVTDCAGNTSSDVQTITIYDDTAPVLTLPADIRFECEMGDAGMATAEDNCDGMLEPSYSDDLSGLDNCGFGDILRTWTVTDCAGNTSSDVQTITIYDDTAPVLTLPADIRFECEMGDAGMATAEDNCDGMLEPSYSDDLSGLDNCGFGDILRTWTVTDCAGNTSSDVQTITIYDDTAPVLSLPADIRFECEMGDAGMATAEDNCDGMLEPSYSDDLSGLDNCGFGDILRTWTVTDCAGNTSSDVQTITIYDDTAPVLSLPADIRFECEMGDAGMATAEDNCDGMLEPSYSDDLSGLDNCGFGDILRTWTVTDCAGNTSSDVQTITIYDDTAPVLSLPADIRFECEMGDAGMATAEDNCDGMLEPSYSDDLSGLDNCGFGDILRTWTVTDCAGNTSSDVQTITIYDDTAPVLTLPADIRFECEMGDAGMATAMDNCDGELVPTYSDDVVLEHCGVITRTWTVSDCAGNTTTGVQLITVYDETPPTIMGEDYAICNEELPPSLTVEWTDNCSEGGTVTAAGVPYSSDECTTVYAYTFQVVDDCGNPAEKIIYVTKETTKYGYCETAIAKLDGDYESDARCFREDGFSRWGWTNLITEEGQYTLPLYAGAAQCIVAKGTLVGQVVVDYDGSTVNVEYQIDEGYALSEAHIYVGCEPYPTKNGKPTVAPGQFTFNGGSLEHVNGLTAEFDNVHGGFYIIAHAVTCEVICSCTQSLDPVIADGYEPMDLGIDCQLSADEPDEPTIQIDQKDESVVVKPNPFHEYVDFVFTAEKDGVAKIELFNLTGQKVATIMKQKVVKGQAVQVQYVPHGIVTGTYVYRYMLGGTVITGQLIYQESK
ncbi:T9SS type A sorting domain-containing protein [Mangrovibacterium marinum]|uniref:T9SS type A sorting domain-containing protein n=2 Tax=Mangrovibacterium marinum TaxID=1639118 RepID=UPI002A18ADFE|nr:T9SS type A sorting domain-containing protein [Mangrovibacterium marinum]